MKSAMKFRSMLILGLLAVGGAGALPATAFGDGQEQARLLLAGAGASPYSPKSGFVSPSSIDANSIAADAQAQAREMILGRQFAKSPIIKPDGLRAAGSWRDRKGAADPHEMGRRMILGSRSAGTAGKVRLTSKPDELERGAEESR
jgi:hypothetical protein